MGVLSVFDGVFLAAVLYENERRRNCKAKTSRGMMSLPGSCVPPAPTAAGLGRLWVLCQSCPYHRPGSVLPAKGALYRSLGFGGQMGQGPKRGIERQWR